MPASHGAPSSATFLPRLVHVLLLLATSLSAATTATAAAAAVAAPPAARTPRLTLIRDDAPLADGDAIAPGLEHLSPVRRLPDNVLRLFHEHVDRTHAPRDPRIEPRLWTHVMQQDRSCANGLPPNDLGSPPTFRVYFNSQAAGTDLLPVRRAVLSAVEQWREYFRTSVPIRICILWVRMDSSTLGSTTNIYTPGASRPPLVDALYTRALASALTGVDILNGEDYHVTISLNRLVDWHFQESIAPLKRYDLTTTALHELTHGLFFTGSVSVHSKNETAYFQLRSPTRFDQFMVVEGNIGVARSCDPGNGLYNAVRSPNLRFLDDGTGANFGLYAPPVFEPGSSVYHLSNLTIESDCARLGIENVHCSDLMTHELRRGYTKRHLGATTLRVYDAVRSSALGAPGGVRCNVPNYTVSAVQPQEDRNKIMLPVWGIIMVAGIAVVGLVLVVLVVATTFASK